MPNFLALIASVFAVFANFVSSGSSRTPQNKAQPTSEDDVENVAIPARSSAADDQQSEDRTTDAPDGSSKSERSFSDQDDPEEDMPNDGMADDDHDHRDMGGHGGNANLDDFVDMVVPNTGSGDGGMNHDDMNHGSGNGSMDHDGGGGMDHTDHGVPSTPVPSATANQAELDEYVAAIRATPETHMHGSDSAKMSEHMAAMDLAPRSEATHIAISNGDWFDPDTWYGGEIPDDDAKVLIPEGVSVSYGAESDARLFTVRVDGKLDFDTDTDSRIVFDTMVVSPTGHLEIGTVDNPVQDNVSVDLVIANNGPIDTDWDPMLLSRGIVSHGKADIHGAEKDSHEKVSADPMKGDNTLTFDDAPEGWQVGDTVVVAGTRYDGHKWDNDIKAVRLYESEDEVRVITAINGNTITLDRALEHDHDTPRDDLHTSVANYTRNVTVSTENSDDAEVFERGHVMFMHSDDVDVRYAEFHELGRTDKSISSKQVDDFETIASDSNVQGRYSLHLHRTGVDDLDNPAQIVGNAVWGSPGWGYVHHDSNAILENNASFDTFGAGYVAETGNETGAWNDNIAILAQGISWNAPKNTTDIDEDTFDTGRGGDGFWFQGRMVEASDNVAASVNTGFVYFHRTGDGRMIEFDSSLFEHADALFGDETVWPGIVPIRDFSNNEVFAAREGLHIVKANPNQGHDIWSELDGLKAWSVTSGAHLEYTSHYLLTDFDVIGVETSPGQFADAGISFGTNTSEIVIVDAKVSGFETGIDLVKSFNGVADADDEHNFVVIDATIENAETDFGNYDPNLDQVISKVDLVGGAPDLDLDGKLTFDGSSVKIFGTKTDSIGDTIFPGGTDSFDIDRASVLHVLENDGYWTTSTGESYFNVDIYFTDRLNGDVYYETHPVFVEDNIASFLGGPYGHYTKAIHNGEQDIVESGGQVFAGDQLLDTAIDPLVFMDMNSQQSGQDMMAALANGQDALDETMPNMMHHMMEEAEEMHIHIL